MPTHRAIGIACALGTVLCLCNASAHGASLIKNGSFEKPAVPSGSFTSFSTGQNFDHWTVVGASGSVAIFSGTYAESGFTFPGKKGEQWLDLTGAGSNSATGVAQTISTTPGGSYLLTFFVGNIDNPGGMLGTQSIVKVLVNGSQVFSATNKKGQGTTAQAWKKFSTTITAPSASTTIAFINGDPHSDGDNGLDAVSLVPSP
jgi:hypothetical protein